MPRSTWALLETENLKRHDMDGINLSEYDRAIVAFSGGKDSLACLIWLVDQGFPREKIELWHHEVDGRGVFFMDWPCTPKYCQIIADAFKVPIYFSWKDGGFLGEMLRNNEPTKPTLFETPSGEVLSSGGKGPAGTRLKFPQVSADLRVRWCSAYLKIDVMDKAVTGQERFNNSKTLVLSGERAEESPGRARYSVFEPDRTDARGGRKKRHIDRMRPVHKLKSMEVWEMIGRVGVIPHPAYYSGWGRLSCRSCIFGSANQWATIRKYFPDNFNEIAGHESSFGVTINRKMSISQLADMGTPYEIPDTVLLGYLRLKVREFIYFPEQACYPAIISPENWVLPKGAMGESCGPV